MRLGVYAIYDSLAHALLSGLHLHKHEATAIRLFSDIANQPNSRIAMHPHDHHLVRLGYLLEEDGKTHELVPDYQVVLTGTQWAAAQTPSPEGGPR